MKKIYIILFLFIVINTSAYSNSDCSQIKKLSKDYLSCLGKKAKEKRRLLKIRLWNFYWTNCTWNNCGYFR